MPRRTTINKVNIVRIADPVQERKRKLHLELLLKRASLVGALLSLSFVVHVILHPAHR